MEHADRPQVSVTVFFVDGLDHVQLERLLAEGRLPNIQRHFVEGGVHVRTAVSSLPPVTYANSVSIITGRFPGHHGILGNLWFDRSARFFRDYGSAATYRAVNDDFACPTVYDLLDDEFTVSVQAHTRRGVKLTIDNWAKSGVSWFLQNYSDVDRRVGESVAQVEQAARGKRRWPVVYFNYFPGLDEIGHREGSDSAAYAAALAVVDQAIGNIINRTGQLQVAAQRYHVLLTDHGHVPVDPADACDLKDWLERTHGLRVRTAACQEATALTRHATLNRYDAVLITGAARCAMIHLRGDAGWDHPPPPDLVDAVVGWPLDANRPTGIVHRPHVRLACTRSGEAAVRVVSRNGAARIERRVSAGQKQYRVILDNSEPAADPLGYSADPALAEFIAAGWHDSRAWLAATAQSGLPDFVPQVAELFDAPRAGDIVVFADEDGVFEPVWRGGHGSCLARDMVIPLYFAGPGLPPGGEIPTARLVDVMPTVLDLLGCADRLDAAPGIDGVSLLPALRAARGAD